LYISIKNGQSAPDEWTFPEKYDKCSVSAVMDLMKFFDQGTRRLYCLMVFNATFNNISVISWRSVLLVEETGGPGENH
jgi:hypothetical protein